MVNGWGMQARPSPGWVAIFDGRTEHSTEKSGICAVESRNESFAVSPNTSYSYQAHR